MKDIYRKHISQMTKEEKIFLMNSVSDLNVSPFSNHLMKRKEERYVDSKDILDVFNDYSIIEYNYNEQTKTHRVLIRGNKSVDGYNLCLSVDLVNGTIYTVYKNKCEDNHKTINMDNYNLGGINIIKYIEMFS